LKIKNEKEHPIKLQGVIGWMDPELAAIRARRMAQLQVKRNINFVYLIKFEFLN
jgi:hypothetical protein